MEVETINAPGPEGLIVPRCTLCGAVIENLDGPASEADPSVSLGLEESFTDDSVVIPDLDTTLLVGYTPSVRQTILDKMVERQLSREILPCQNGEEMIVKIIDSLSNDGKGRIDLVVTDVPMPFLNGINAAVGLRAIERSYPEHDLIPILFLTNKACDETFKKVIRYLTPAKYATLGPVDQKDQFESHLNRVFSLVAKEKW